MDIKIPIEVSARHIHLSKDDLEKLFGKGYQLKKMKQLTQPFDFSAEETLDTKINSQVLKNLRIVGPLREKTQVELSITDAVGLKIEPPIRLSGDIAATPGIILIGPAGEVELEKGVIIAKRHIHCSTSEAEKLGFKNGDVVSVKVEGERPIIFKEVAIRVRDDYKLCLHLDTDEGNAAGINKIGQGIIL